MTWWDTGSVGTQAHPTNSEWIVPFTPGQLCAVPSPRSRWSPGSARPPPPTSWRACSTAPNPYADGEISVADTAERLGVSTGVVYDWINTGKLTARRGTGNLLCIPWNEHIESECRCRITESGHLNPSARHTSSRTRA
ncbi:helix-turn-helix domain-containing protein [Candidatus Mycobacterium methanotrophicum]|uniref:Helix-turn-helix domain-containing protein n=1 Tax=Candidatus Mycobacterium methanotrophicum TaxID=2943498 RepID=A0ABY4QJM5_9MYCO|nr:helix-turn-helix domain-containing protein [Candidatus Mycobacterium methanotrophicum]UQX11217.1 helix-turn-helix domain-containing protein [Candidatus Mycobacterium methanotrophicum]